MSQADEECKHPVQLFGMCAVCGKPVDTESEESASLSVMHSNAAVKVSVEEAQRLDSETTSHLLSQRKLALIVDLDQTIIHATVDPTVGEWMRDESNPNYEALKSVGKFRLGIDGEEIKDDDDENAPKDSAARACWYYVKPRPGVPEILKRLSEMYQLHVYTMGTRSYANCVCKLIDPDASIFGNRILSRDENGSLVRKSLNRLFPVDHSMVVIIDDREDVWSRSPNLLPVVPYEFFVGIGDINATFLPTPPPPPGALPDAATAAASTSASKLDDASSAAPSSPKSGTDAPSTTSTAATSDTTVEEALQKAREEGKSEEELKQVRATAIQFAAQTEKLQSKLAEQREARPLAKMQEALDEKLGIQNGGSRSGTTTPNGSGGATPIDETPAETESSDAAAAAEASTIEEDKAPTSESAASNSTSPSDGTLPPLPPPPPLPPHRSHAVLVDDDTELDRVYDILSSLHTEWYTAYDSLQSQSQPPATKPSVLDLISKRKSTVLSGCTIVFSSMIPTGHDPETSDLWALAREFGAIPASEIEEGVTTHVVAARPGTFKVLHATRLAKQGKVELVWPSWFHVSTSRWERQDEGLYRLPQDGKLSDDEWAKAKSAEEKRVEEQAKASTTNPIQEDEKAVKAEAEGEGQEGEALFESELNDMDWGAAADEVDAYLDSATTASNTSSPSPSMLANDGDLPDINDGDEPIVGLSDNVGSRKRARMDQDDLSPAGNGGEDGLLKKQRSNANEGDEDEEDEDGGDSFLDDLANELDGQLDNE